MPLTAHAQIRIIRCQCTRLVLWPTSACLHKMCCSHRTINSNPTDHPCMQPATNSSLWKSLDPYPLKVFSVSYKATSTDMEAVHRISQISRTHPTCTLPFTKSHLTRLNQI